MAVLAESEARLSTFGFDDARTRDGSEGDSGTAEAGGPSGNVLYFLLAKADPPFENGYL